MTQSLHKTERASFDSNTEETLSLGGGIQDTCKELNLRNVGDVNGKEEMDD